MAKRSYHQFCPLAYSLDVIGERWTLLIVRELMFGPRRYTDLLSGLPGIGTNLLANRLKDMEAADIIKQATLPPPAASKVYLLTERGQGLVPIIRSLADWGMAYLGDIPEEDSVGVVQAMAGMTKLAPETFPHDVTLACEFHADGEVFHAQVQAGALQVGFGSVAAPDIIVEVDLKMLLYLINGFPRTEAEAAGKLKILSGTGEALDRFASLYG